jgi:cytochrome c biogenesis protein CcmG, thiol:disulfide interchange protein DsbE
VIQFRFMVARHTIPWRVLLIALALAVACAFADSGDPEPAPHFHAKTLDGAQFDNDSIKGKVVLLEFWTTWCPYCAAEENLVDRLGAEFGEKGLIVLAVNVGESKKTVKKYLANSPRKTPVVVTDDTNLAAMYEATVYPIYVVIGRDGNIAGTQRGAGGERALRELLAQAGIKSNKNQDAEQADQ